MSSDYSNPVSTFLPEVPNPIDLFLYTESLEIIAQPCYTSKLRYRSDYENNKNRRGVLHGRSNQNYHSPAIRIPTVYRDVAQQYYVRVCLVTVFHETNQCRYIHPYELEDINNAEYNDRSQNAVWFPIERDDKDGIKTFPNLRIVKKKADDLKNHGPLQVFDSPTAPKISQSSTAKDTIKEFNLDKCQLAFTLGERSIVNGALTYISYASTTIFSDELIEMLSRDSDPEMTPSESTTRRSRRSKSANCQMYKYAPRNGYTDSNEEILMFFTYKLKPKKYGDLQVTFECDTNNGRWSEPVLNLEVKDQMVSFRAPRFPFPIDSCTTVDVIFQQRKRNFEPLTFDYIPIAQCPQCQRNASNNPPQVLQTNPNKRSITEVYGDDDEETDHATNLCENNPADEEQDVTPSFETANLVSESLISPDLTQQVLDKLADGIAALFSNQDFLPVLRLCRSFVRKRPELLHEAIQKNYSELLTNFVSIAGLELLQQRNKTGETVLLHTVRLNRLNIVKSLLARDNSDQLLEDMNNEKQNILHILALNKTSDEMWKLILNHLLKKSIDIQAKFDHADRNDHTPLQLAVLSKNISAVHHLVKYSCYDIHVINNYRIDDIIQHAMLDDNCTRIK